MVSGLNSNGNIIYNNIAAPNLFNEGLATGKTPYDKYQLRFNREGDKYTLTSVTGTKTSDLHKFKYGRYNWDKTLYMWSNEFWPMDNVPSAGTAGHDAKFGSTEYTKFFNTNNASNPTNNTVAQSDFGVDHNSYFGMAYSVKFDLARDYIGPLNYCFFGDDDMWVFLDGKLICDIGGVHNSVGEYVDLWDYLDINENKNHTHVDSCYDGNGKLKCSTSHTLSFFYTERGASGSACWMQFTLPSVSSMSPQQSVGQITNSLKVGKTVENAETNQEYKFKIHFTKDSEDLPDDYSYTKYKRFRVKDKDGKPMVDADGNPVYEKDDEGKEKFKVIDSDILICDGGEFTLGDGEYIIVNYLPVGTHYTIEEVTKSDQYDINIIGGDGNSGEVEDDMGNVDSTVEYVNEYHLYNLPETGGSGIIIYTIAGALCILLGAGFMYTKKARERRV